MQPVKARDDMLAVQTRDDMLPVKARWHVETPGAHVKP